MRILGIDPGLANTGYALIEHAGNQSRLLDHGCIVTTTSQNPAQRLHQIHERIVQVIREGKPDAAALEQLFFSINVKSAMAVSEARGVIILATVHSNLPLTEYTPQQIKQAVTGGGRAGKEQVQRMVRVLLSLEEIPGTTHEADAMAIALCHAHSHGFASALKQAGVAAAPASARLSGLAIRRRRRR